MDESFADISEITASDETVGRIGSADDNNFAFNPILNQEWHQLMADMHNTRWSSQTSDGLPLQSSAQQLISNAFESDNRALDFEELDFSQIDEYLLSFEPQSAQSVVINEENQRMHASDNSCDSDFNLDDYLDTSGLQINNTYNRILAIAGDSDYIPTHSAHALQNAVPIEGNQFVDESNVVTATVVGSSEVLAIMDAPEVSVTPESLIELNAVDITIQSAVSSTQSHRRRGRRSLEDQGFSGEEVRRRRLDQNRRAQQRRRNNRRVRPYGSLPLVPSNGQHIRLITEGQFTALTTVLERVRDAELDGSHIIHMDYAIGLLRDLPLTQR